MQRRSGSGQPVKGRHTTGPKPREASRARVSTTDLQEQVAALTRELTEAREQLTEALIYLRFCVRAVSATLGTRDDCLIGKRFNKFDLLPGVKNRVHA
jgi:hypothetical protein